MISVIALAAISTSASAFDYKINLEGRADFNNLTTTTTNRASGAESSVRSNGFLSSLVRLNMVGAINDNLSYRMRYRLNTEGATTARDASTTALDYLYIDHKNSMFTTRFGKMNWAEAYGRESFISSTDLFVASDAYSAYNSNVGNYRFGVSATATFMETQKFTLAVSNPNVTVTDAVVGAADANNKSLALGAHYSSVMFDKMFQPLLSYTYAPQDGDMDAATPTKTQAYTMMAAGWRTEAMGLTLDADYKQFNKKGRTVTAGATDGKTSSIFANLAYSVGQLTPFIQYVNDKFEGEVATGDYKKNTFAVGTMYKPFADTNFRYHVLYTMADKKFDNVASTSTKIKDSKITIGMKIDI